MKSIGEMEYGADGWYKWSPSLRLQVKLVYFRSAGYDLMLIVQTKKKSTDYRWKIAAMLRI